MHDNAGREVGILSEWAITLLILEGIPALALVYYLGHKKLMYMLEKGIVAADSSALRAERRMINGLFLILAGVSMILLPGIAPMLGINASPSFELLLAGVIVLCAGIAMLVGSGLIRYKNHCSSDADSSVGLKWP